MLTGLTACLSTLAHYLLNNQVDGDIICFYLLPNPKKSRIYVSLSQSINTSFLLHNFRYKISVRDIAAVSQGMARRLMIIFKSFRLSNEIRRPAEVYGSWQERLESDLDRVKSWLILGRRSTFNGGGFPRLCGELC